MISPYYWSDFAIFFIPFVLHHDLNKECRGAWHSLEHNFRCDEVVAVIDAAEAININGLENTNPLTFSSFQQLSAAFSSFQPLSSHIWVVVIFFHVDDLGNISGENKQKHLFFLIDLGMACWLCKRLNFSSLRMQTSKTKVGFSMYFGR